MHLYDDIGDASSSLRGSTSSSSFVSDSDGIIHLCLPIVPTQCFVLRESVAAHRAAGEGVGVPSGEGEGGIPAAGDRAEQTKGGKGETQKDSRGP